MARTPYLLCIRASSGAFVLSWVGAVGGLARHALRPGGVRNRVGPQRNVSPVPKGKGAGGLRSTLHMQPARGARPSLVASGDGMWGHGNRT